MKTNNLKIRTLFTNHPYDMDEDEIKEILLESGYEEDEITDKTIWQEWDFQVEDSLEFFKDNAERIEGTFVITASLGLWNGIFAGGKVIEGNLWDACCKCFKDYNKAYFEGKQFKIDACHHDGNNYFTIKKLTEKGEKYYSNHYYDKSDREMVEVLMNDSHYSHCIRF